MSFWQTAITIDPQSFPPVGYADLTIEGDKMTIANLPSIMGAGLIAGGMLLVLVQFFFRPRTDNGNIYGALVTIIIAGAVVLSVGSFVHR